MVKVDLKGIAKVTAKGRTYWYAWRGGPRLSGEPGSPEFMASYNEAIEQRITRFIDCAHSADADRFQQDAMIKRSLGALLLLLALLHDSRFVLISL